MRGLYSILNNTFDNLFPKELLFPAQVVPGSGYGCNYHSFALILSKGVGSMVSYDYTEVTTKGISNSNYRMDLLGFLFASRAAAEEP